MRQSLSRAVLGALALGTVVACNVAPAPEAAPREVKQGLLDGPDLVVTALSAPPTATPYTSFPVTVTVCNQGNESVHTEVLLLLSQDSVLSQGTDEYIDNQYLGYLSPGACATANVGVSSVVGQWYVGAIADPGGFQTEVNEDNNERLSAPLAIGYGPDFIVTSVTSPPSAQPNTAFTASVTVCNQGTVAGSTTVELYLSADDIIQPGPGPQPPDMVVAGAPVGPLNPGQCTTVSMTGNAYRPPPGTDGPYHVGAMVDPTHGTPELFEENNTNAGSVMGVGNGPDFIVTSVTGPASRVSGQPLTAQVTVCNQGTQPGDTDVGLFLSVDGAIIPTTPPGPGEDAPVGFAPVGTLNPGQCVTVPVSGSAYLPPPGPDGAYLLGAVVDPSRQRPELQEGNNAHAGYVLGVGNRADFVVTSVKGPASVVPGQLLKAVVTVCNQGTLADGVELELYLSADAIIRPMTGQSSPPEDVRVGGAAAPGLVNPGQCVAVPVSGNVSLPPPGAEGTYHLGAAVDPGNLRVELIEDNNTHSGYVLGVGSRPDFIVTHVTGPDSVTTGQSLTARVTVCNQGTQPGNSTVVVLLSRDELIGVSGPSGNDDAYVGRGTVGTLNPGQCTTVPVNGAVYPTDFRGAYYLGAMVERVSGAELNFDNNTSSGYRMGVGTMPDFVVTAVTGPASVAKGATFTASFTVCNRGLSSQSANVNVYLSADGTIRVPAPPLPPEDHLLASVTGINVNVGACVNRSVSVTLPAALEGGFTLGAVVDPANLRLELIEDNNTLAGSRLGVGSQPDFVATAVTSPELTVKSGAGFRIDTTLCNRGRLSGAVDADLYLFVSPATAGTQAPASPEGYFLGRMPSVSLAASACVTRPLLGTVPGLVPDGTYFLGAVVDPLAVRTELIEDNNVLTGSRIAVGIGPELLVTAVIGQDSVRLGWTFTATVDVCNRGLVPVTTDVDLFMSADETIRLPTPPRAPEDTFLGTVTGVALGARTCVSRSLPVRATVPSTGGYYVGAAVDPRFTLAEFFEDNNTLAFGFISVTP